MNDKEKSKIKIELYKEEIDFLKKDLKSKIESGQIYKGSIMAFKDALSFINSSIKMSEYTINTWNTLSNEEKKKKNEPIIELNKIEYQKVDKYLKFLQSIILSKIKLSNNKVNNIGFKIQEIQEQICRYNKKIEDEKNYILNNIMSKN